MKKVLMFCVIGMVLTSCSHTTIEAPIIVGSVTSTKCNSKFESTWKYVVVIQNSNVSLYTNTLYQVGDTIK